MNSLNKQGVSARSVAFVSVHCRRCAVFPSPQLCFRRVMACVCEHTPNIISTVVTLLVIEAELNYRLLLILICLIFGKLCQRAITTKPDICVFKEGDVLKNIKSIKFKM